MITMEPRPEGYRSALNGAPRRPRDLREDEQAYAAYLAGYSEGLARQLGRIHGMTGRDLLAGDVAALVAACGDTHPDTEPAEMHRNRLAGEYQMAFADTAGRKPEFGTGQGERVTTSTHRHVLDAIDSGSALVLDELELGDRDHDLIELVVKSVLAVLDSPQGSTLTLDEVIEQRYPGSTPAAVRSWWTKWE